MSDSENSILPDPSDSIDHVEPVQANEELPEVDVPVSDPIPEVEGGQEKRTRKKRAKADKDFTDATDVMTRPLPTASFPVTFVHPPEKPVATSVTITNRTQQVLGLEIRAVDGRLHGIQLLARNSITWPKQEDYGADVKVKLRRKLISILPVK